MDFAELNKNDLLSLFNYVGKKFNRWEELDTNWGLDINEPINFPVGVLYAKDYDQAGTNYWFYDGVVSYGMYVWSLLDGVCSVITIKKGKYISNENNFRLEKNLKKYHQNPLYVPSFFHPY